MKIEVPATQVEEKKTDDRGRLNLGVDYADQTVTIAVLETDAD